MQLTRISMIKIYFTKKGVLHALKMAAESLNIAHEKEKD